MSVCMCAMAGGESCMTCLSNRGASFIKQELDEAGNIKRVFIDYNIGPKEWTKEEWDKHCKTIVGRE